MCVMLVDVGATLRGHGLELAKSLVAAVSILEQRAGRLVARAETTIGPVVVKASRDADAFADEMAAIARLAAAGLPVAEVHGSAAGPPAYLVLSWTEGEPLCASTPMSAQRAVGEVLRRIHSVATEPTDLGWGDASWEGWMAGWLNSTIGWWSTVDRLSEERVRRLWAWYHDLAPLLATRGGELILYDGRPDHIRVRDGWEIGLIDVAAIRLGDAAMDLGVIAVSEPDVLPGVLAGYRPDADEQAAFARLVPFYTLLRRISRAEWHQRHGTPEELGQALARLADTEVPT